jgi:hypothetical protein
VPVFFAERPYWLFLTHKKSAPIAQHLPLLGADCAEWDPSSKSWRITHDRVGDALDAVSKVAADIKICDDCHSGEPDDCQAWDPIDGEVVSVPSTPLRFTEHAREVILALLDEHADRSFDPEAASDL